MKFKHKIKIWPRNVENVFAILDKESDEAKILEEWNTIDKKIKFTSETEKNNKIIKM